MPWSRCKRRATRPSARCWSGVSPRRAPARRPDPDTFRMVNLLLFAFDGREDLLNPLGDC